MKVKVPAGSITIAVQDNVAQDITLPDGVKYFSVEIDTNIHLDVWISSTDRAINYNTNFQPENGSVYLQNNATKRIYRATTKQLSVIAGDYSTGFYVNICYWFEYPFESKHGEISNNAIIRIPDASFSVHSLSPNSDFEIPVPESARYVRFTSLVNYDDIVLLASSGHINLYPISGTLTQGNNRFVIPRDQIKRYVYRLEGLKTIWLQLRGTFNVYYFHAEFWTAIK